MARVRLSTARRRSPILPQFVLWLGSIKMIWYSMEFAIAHLRSGFSSRRILEIVATNEGEEFLNYCPEWTNLYHKIRAKYDALVQDIESHYSQHQDIAVQKDFALAIKHLPYSGILFDLRKGKTNSVKEALADTSIQKLKNLLQIDFVDLGQ